MKPEARLTATSRMRWRRLLTAALAAGPAGGMCAGLVMSLLSAMRSFIESGEQVAMDGFLGGIVFGWPATVVVALPGHMLLMRLRRRSLKYYGMLGATVGAFTLVAHMVIFNAPLSALLIIAHFLGGLIGGAVFWAVRRPDLAR